VAAFTPIARDVTARGTRTRVVEIGSGPPLVLLHGFLGTHRVFDDVLEPLASRFHVLALDLPGFGDSEKPAPSRFNYGLETFAEVVADVIAALHVGRSHLLGHGLGGSVALTLAAEHPEFVDHLVLVAPQIFPQSLSRQTRSFLMPLLGAFIFKQVFGRSMFRRYFNNEVYGPGHAVPPDRIDSLYDSFNSPAARESAYAVLRASLDTRTSIARLTRVRAPTMVVWGRADSLVTPLDAAKLVRQIPSACMEFVDSGHSPQEEQPGQFVFTVQKFLLDQRQ
jgi:pimeloyl-ACP methyl ester carboxylesterase